MPLPFAIDIFELEILYVTLWKDGLFYVRHTLPMIIIFLQSD